MKTQQDLLLITNKRSFIMSRNPVKVARTNFIPAQSRTSVHKGPLLDPFEIDPAAIIQPAEDFTISINTISKELYSRYAENYLAGKYNNDYFVLLSRIGIGNPSQPTTKLNFLEHIRDMNQDYTDIWAENVAIVDDYGKTDGTQRLYISFHAFCQDLGDSPIADIKEAGNIILNLTGSIFPTLMPLTSLGGAIATGVKNIFSKLSTKSGECKKVEFNLYPVTDRNEQIPGEAPLQEGSYILFFESTNLDSLYLDSDGIVRSTTDEPIKPYIVVNIKKGKRLAPGNLDINAATEVLSRYQTNYGYLLPGSSTNKQASSNGMLGALQEFGQSYRIMDTLKRYYQLKSQPIRSIAENTKLTELTQTLKSHFNDQNWG